MSDSRISIAILCGGKSPEHEVSLQSAQSIYQAIDQSKYKPYFIVINKQGIWRYSENLSFLQNANNPNAICISENTEKINITQSGQILIDSAKKPLNNHETKPDIIFPVLHGPLGEDGCIQGMLKIMNYAYVGSDLLGSALGMDKDIMKRLLKAEGLPIANYRLLHISNKRPSYAELRDEFGIPFFVKPANMGSSIGVCKVEFEAECDQALTEAFRFDRKVLVEKNIKGREIECAVLGNDKPNASVLGEILPKHAFYSYKAKYLDTDGSEVYIPAQLDPKKQSEIQEFAVKAFNVLNCQGCARVDFFLGDSGEITINEVNTMPGFTRISMYPKLWEASGLSYGDLIDKLIQLGFERFDQMQALHRSL